MKSETQSPSRRSELSDTPTLHIRHEGDGRTRIMFENGDSEDLIVTSLTSNLYRLEESSFVGEMRYLDVIRAIPLEGGSLLFKEVVTPSTLATQSWVVSKEIVESPELSKVLDRVMAIGGNWEQAFGGVLIIHLPKELMDMIAEQINGLH